MSVDSALRLARRAAEARMTSRCKVRRATGRTTQDEGTGEEVPVWDLLYSNLPFRMSGVPSAATPTRLISIGGAEFQQALRTAHVPADVTDLADGDLIEVTSGDNAGRVLRIVEATWQDQATARRMPVVEVDRPAEWS